MRIRSTAQPRKYLIVSSLFAGAFVVLATALAWPIYETPALFLSMFSAIFGAAALVFLYTFYSWSWFKVLIAAVAYFLLVGVPVSSSNFFSSFSSALSSWLTGVTAVIFGWKELVTIDLPVGTYQSLLVPFFIVLFISILIPLIILWNSSRLFWILIPFMFLPMIFVIAFGALNVNTSLRLGTLSLPLSPGMIAGLAFIGLAILFMSWGSRFNRRKSLTQTPSLALKSQSRGRRVRQRALSFSVFAGASIAVFAIIVASGINPIREVLRSAIDPEVTIREQVSPLSLYREAFTDPDIYSAQWLTFSSDGPTPDRIRLAVLPYFDGQVFRVVSDGGVQDQNSAFSRVPTDIKPAHTEGDISRVEIRIGEYDGIWMPTTMGLNKTVFQGPNQGDLIDGFFYNRAASAGVVIPGLSSGDTFVLETYTEGKTTTLQDVVPDQKNLIDPDLYPESLKSWVELQEFGVNVGGEQLQTLIDRLRARGYLSHSLTEPSAGGEEKVWTSDLPGYNFKPSLAGHSTGRIGDLFSSLVEKQNSATDKTNDALLVAAVGDDEQFAAAAALMASYLGFSSRVAVGFNTLESSDERYVIPSCEDGVCTGSNLTAWVEILDADGAWVAVDTTPQFKNQIAPESQDRQDPQNPTQVDPENASNLPPPAANPANGEVGEDNNSGGLDLGWLFNLLRTVLISLLVIVLILSPFALIIGSKMYRRKKRRSSPNTTSTIAGAWEEFVDNAVDFGYPLPQAQTRTELVELYQLPQAMALVELSDVAVFGPKEMSQKAADSAWHEADSLRKMFTSQSSKWKNIITVLSLKSFVRGFRGSGIETSRKGMSSLTSSQTQLGINPFVALGNFIISKFKRSNT